ncbi:hypothetical protein JCM5353_004445 [Sporobolomyces roseus]
MTPVPQSSVKIDRLSSLPPELLLTIFDLSYDPDQLPLEPLSKRLLPYFRRNLYRQIRISSLFSFTKLLETIESVPAFGNLVNRLDTSAAFNNGDLYDISGDFNKIVSPFPRLVSAKLGNIRPLEDAPPGPSLPSLEHLCYACEILSIDDLASLSQYQLRELEISFRSTEGSTAEPIPSLKTVKILSLTFTVEGILPDDNIWEPNLATIVECCPNITSLRLFDPVFPDYRAFLSAIPRLTHQITSLELDSPRLPEEYDIACDDLLPQFSILVHLSLGDGTISEFLPSYLRQLPQLASLRLGPDTHFALGANDLLSLLEGPTRLPSLRHLTFDCFGGMVGKRIKVGDQVKDEVNSGMKADGWECPRLGHEVDDDDPRETVRACRASRIELNGDPPGALTIEEDFDLEFANRSVLRSLQIKNLDGVKLRNNSPRFSHIPIASLDPQNLKLVKTDLPEKNWFRLSLEIPSAPANPEFSPPTLHLASLIPPAQLTQIDLKMDVVPENSAKIDRLSALPPELLLTIFDLSYDPDNLLLEPLSERLLPCFRRNLYRHIRLGSSHQFDALRETVLASPHLSDLVIELDISRAFSSPQRFVKFEEIVEAFPQLVSLNGGALGASLRPSSRWPDFDLPPLEHLSYQCDSPVVEDLDALSHLSNLRTLEIIFKRFLPITPPTRLPQLPTVEQLSLILKPWPRGEMADGNWYPSFTNLIDCCPNLTSLRLCDPQHPYYRAILSNSSSFASRITSLELDSAVLDNNPEISCDHLLPRFSNLTHLSLGDGTVSPSLPSHLRQLPLLYSLRMGPASHANLVGSDFISLLQGPTRLPSLRHLAFYSFGGSAGRRIQVDDDEDIDHVESGMLDHGWQEPVFSEDFSESDGYKLESACKKNGIHYEGDVALASRIQEEYDLEEANRSVLVCLQLKTLDGLKDWSGTPRFPHIPIEHLDPQNLKLVKTELPEKNWFRLSLE